MEPTCLIDDCDRPARARGICAKHYKRFRTAPWFKAKFPPTRTRSTVCSVDDCYTIGDAGLGLCVKHNRRQKTHGDTSVVAISNWVGDNIGYPGMHARVASQRGSARDQACCDCGKAAREWSYDGLDANERTDVGLGMRFSLDVMHYAARCVGCHRRHDAAERRVRS